MFSEYCDARENSDILSGITDGFFDDNLDKREEGKKKEEGKEMESITDKNTDRSEKEPENEKLEEARNRANEWYKVLSNAYPGGFEINQNGNESTKISLSKSLTGFSIRVSHIQKEDDKETTIDSGVLNFENIFPQGSDQSGTAQKDKNLIPSFSVTGNNALLSQLFHNPEGQNNGGLDIANQDFCSVVDALGNNESVIAKKIEAVYGYANDYLQKFRDRYIKEDLESLAEGNYNFNKIDKNDKAINIILDDSMLDESTINNYLFIRKALLSSCILLRSSSKNNQRAAINQALGVEVNQALGVINNLKNPQGNNSSLTSGEGMVELLALGDKTGNITSIISNLDTLVEGAKSCINGDSNMEEDMKNQILNLLNKQNDKKD